MLLFVIVPILEIVVIIQVGQVIGAWWTVGLLVADSVLGAWLVRHQGSRAWRAFRRALEEGRWPGDEVAQGALIIVGGTLLLTPGFITDVVGFLLLIPISRRVVSRVVRARLRTQVVGVPGTGRPRDGGPRRGGPRAPGVMDVEVVDIRREEDPRPTRPELADEAGGTAGPEDTEDGTSDGPEDREPR